MATIAEQLLGIASQTQQNQPDLAGNFAKGAELAMQAEALQQKKSQVEAQKAENEMKKFEMVGGWLDTYAKMPEGGAKSAFGKKFVPNGIVSLGLQDKIHPNVIEMMTGDPKLASFLVNEVREGRADVSLLSQPDGVAQYWAEHGQQFGALEDFRAGVDQALPQLADAAKFKLSEAGKTQRAEMVQTGQTGRQQTQIASAGEIEYAKNIADAAKEYSAGGGRDSIVSNINRLDSALADLKSGKVKTGKGLVKWIGGSDFAVDITNPEVSKARDDIRTAIVGTLRPILGGAFAEKEGQRILDLAFNPRLKAAENARRVEAEIEKLKGTVRSKETELLKRGYITERSIPLQEKKSGGGFSPSQEMKSKYSGLSADEKKRAHKIAAEKFGIKEDEAKRLLEAK